MNSPHPQPRDADAASDDILEQIRRLHWCGIYTRQSRGPKDDYSSCQAQFEACLAFVTSRFDDGWVFNGRRYDDEAESSETLERPGFQRLLEHIREGKVQRVVIHRLDRLSRRLADCARILQELHDLRISVTGDGVAEVASEANGWKVGIKEGKYSVEMTGGGDRVQVEDKQVTVSRDKKAIVTITMKPSGAEMAANVTTPAKVTTPANGSNSDLDRRAAEWILTINDGPAPHLFITIAGQITALKDRQLPTEPFHVSDFSLQGPIIDKLGDRLADELATKINGIRVNAIRLASRTLTTAAFC